MQSADKSSAQSATLGDYHVGNILTPRLTGIHGHMLDTSESGTTIRVRIDKIITRTLSCALAVRLVEGSDQLQEAGSLLFLKLFDRRFSKQLRRNGGIDPWTQDKESAYVQSIQNGSVNQFLNNLHTVPRFRIDTEEDWDDAENEAFLADESLRLFTTEYTAYDRLSNHQGRSIPRLVAAVDIDIAPPSPGLAPTAEGDFEPFKVKGIILQYLEGLNLWDIVKHCPRSSWQGIVDQAVDITRMLGEYGILNRDVRPENFIVVPAAPATHGQDQETRYRVFMVDLALCKFREEYESFAQWGMAKETKNEDGAVGLRMQKRLKMDHDFDLKFESSLAYAQWGDTRETDESFMAIAIKEVVRPGEVSYTHPKFYKPQKKLAVECGKQ
ncbi:hypothetical protein B0T24DRAFT_641995 [Lasiosphaeria ovina]|uniref:Protein kinase domain-containing protein n=1 Tax=Lasiosphaeria ovina TaxID=92902 RepID=A0AAE0MYG5_9PEZI|nr:hypothetical protein B0T24DRAFT_641995 [Lasiosphaeria ovina]